MCYILTIRKKAGTYRPEIFFIAEFSNYTKKIRKNIFLFSLECHFKLFCLRHGVYIRSLVIYEKPGIICTSYKTSNVPSVQIQVYMYVCMYVCCCLVYGRWVEILLPPRFSWLNCKLSIRNLRSNAPHAKPRYMQTYVHILYVNMGVYDSVICWHLIFMLNAVFVVLILPNLEACISTYFRQANLIVFVFSNFFFNFFNFICEICILTKFDCE